MHSTVDRNQLTDPKISRLRNGDDTHVIVDGDDDDFSEFDGARIFMEREEKEITKVSIAAGSLPVVIHAASETNPKYDDVVSVCEKISNTDCFSEIQRLKVKPLPQKHTHHATLHQ